MKEEIEELKKQILMLNVGMAIVMRILKQKGFDPEKVMSQIAKEQTNSDKEAEYNKMLDDLEVKKENLN